MSKRVRIARVEKAKRAGITYIIWGLEEDGTYTRFSNGISTRGLTRADLDAERGTVVKIIKGVSMDDL